MRDALDKERAALAAREKKTAEEAARRETDKLRDLEARFDELQKRWQERADQTVAKIEETADFNLIRACREGDGVPVLLKVLRAEGATGAEVARFKHQYERIGTPAN